MADDNELKILCCTCNMGNAKPTRRGVGAWIPEQGAFTTVVPSSSSSSDDEQGSFDMIVIGMQEATWKKNKKKGDIPQEERDSEDEEGDEEGTDADADAEQLTVQTQMSDLSVGKGSPSSKNSSGNNNESDTLYLRVQLNSHVGDKFQLLKEVQRGQMRLYVFVLKKWVSEINDLDGKFTVKMNFEMHSLFFFFGNNVASTNSSLLYSSQGGKHWNCRGVPQQGRHFDSVPCPSNPNLVFDGASGSTRGPRQVQDAE